MTEKNITVDGRTFSFRFQAHIEQWVSPASGHIPSANTELRIHPKAFPDGEVDWHVIGDFIHFLIKETSRRNDNLSAAQSLLSYYFWESNHQIFNSEILDNIIFRFVGIIFRGVDKEDQDTFIYDCEMSPVYSKDRYYDTGNNTSYLSFHNHNISSIYHDLYNELPHSFNVILANRKDVPGPTAITGENTLNFKLEEEHKRWHLSEVTGIHKFPIDIFVSTDAFIDGNFNWTQINEFIDQLKKGVDSWRAITLLQYFYGKRTFTSQGDNNTDEPFFELTGISVRRIGSGYTSPLVHIFDLIMRPYKETDQREYITDAVWRACFINKDVYGVSCDPHHIF